MFSNKQFHNLNNQAIFTNLAFLVFTVNGQNGQYLSIKTRIQISFLHNIDPGIRTHIKIFWIRNTDTNNFQLKKVMEIFFFFFSISNVVCQDAATTANKPTEYIPSS